MAIDTAEKRCSALTSFLPFRFGNVPSGTVSRPDALWTYSGFNYVIITPEHSVAIFIYGPTRSIRVGGINHTISVAS